MNLDQMSNAEQDKLNEKDLTNPCLQESVEQEGIIKETWSNYNAKLWKFPLVLKSFLNGTKNGATLWCWVCCSPPIPWDDTRGCQMDLYQTQAKFDHRKGDQVNKEDVNEMIYKYCLKSQQGGWYFGIVICSLIINHGINLVLHWLFLFLGWAVLCKYLQIWLGNVVLKDA